MGGPTQNPKDEPTRDRDNPAPSGQSAQSQSLPIGDEERHERAEDLGEQREHGEALLSEPSASSRFSFSSRRPSAPSTESGFGARPNAGGGGADGACWLALAALTPVASSVPAAAAVPRKPRRVGELIENPPRANAIAGALGQDCFNPVNISADPLVSSGILFP